MHQLSDAEGKRHAAGRGLEEEPEGAADADAARGFVDSMVAKVVLVAVVGTAHYLEAFAVEHLERVDMEAPTSGSQA